VKRTSALVVAGLALAGASATGTAAAATTTPTCTARYTVVSQWTGGFSAQVVVNYTLPGPGAGWTVGFRFARTDQSVLLGWNAAWNQNGVAVTASSSSPGAMALSGSVTASFVGSYATSNPPAGSLTFDGVPCSQYSTGV
jgi:Cellulose binding domain